MILNHHQKAVVISSSQTLYAMCGLESFLWILLRDILLEVGGPCFEAVVHNPAYERSHAIIGSPYDNPLDFDSFVCLCKFQLEYVQVIVVPVFFCVHFVLPAEYWHRKVSWVHDPVSH